MAMEIRWDDKIVEVSEDKNGGIRDNWVWTQLAPGSYRVSIEGKNYTISAIEGSDSSGKMTVKVSGVEREVVILDERALLLDRMGMSTGAISAELDLCAPMPGKVLSVLVKPGEVVQQGDSLLVLEAMKMENVIKTSVSATVEEVPANAGSAVEKGELLVKFVSE